MAGSTTQARRKGSTSSSSHTVQPPPSAALEAIGARPRLAQRRPTKPASYELANHAKAYLEGGKVASGYDFLHSLLAAGTSISTPAQPYIGSLAPPAYMAFASSLIADPAHTTQAPSSDARQGADAALRYLQAVHSTIDAPAYPTIREAFAFPEERTRRRVTGYRSEANSLSPGAPGGDIERVAGPAANEKSLWRQAEDFWHIIGWAFNCSIAHKKRWDRWKLWLGLMLNFLETDWDVCVKESKGAADPVATVQKSLVWHYLVGEAEATNRSTRRRIVKAILATASPESQKDYPEIWPQETHELKQKAQKDGPVGEIDFETGETGDYASDDDLQEPDHINALPMSNSSARGKAICNVTDACHALGGHDAIELRQRLITLLSQVAQALPTQFTTLADFFDNILEDIIHLPTLTFHILLSTTTLAPRINIAFLANLLLPLVSGSVPDYIRFDPAPEHLEAKLLRFKASTQSYAANAKISLILEQMFLYNMSQHALTPTKQLRSAVEDGIAARHAVLGTGRGKRGNAGEENSAKALMEAASERLRGLLDVLEVAAGESAGVVPMYQRGGEVSLSFTSGSSLSPAPESEGGEGG